MPAARITSLREVPSYPWARNCSVATVRMWRRVAAPRSVGDAVRAAEGVPLSALGVAILAVVIVRNTVQTDRSVVKSANDGEGWRMPERDFSQTPLPHKLGIRPHTTVVLLAAPPGFVELLGPLPDGVVLRTRVEGPLDLAVLFATRRVALLRRFGEAAEALAPDGGLWAVGGVAEEGLQGPDRPGLQRRAAGWDRGGPGG